jgi:hypothetical protein
MQRDVALQARRDANVQNEPTATVAETNPFSRLAREALGPGLPDSLEKRKCKTKPM